MIRRGFVNKVIAALVMLLLFSPISVDARQDQDTAVIDAYIAAQARRERGEEYKEARKVVVGDLTRDGVPETIVLYTIEGQHGTNLSVQYLAVFERHDGKLTALTHADIGGRGKSARGVELNSVEDNAILLDTLNYGPKDAACCPSVKGKTRYILSGKLLQEQKSGTTQKHT